MSAVEGPTVLLGVPTRTWRSPGGVVKSVARRR